RPSAGGTVGVVHLNDTANVTGGDNPTGSVTFYLFAPGAMPLPDLSNAVFSETDALSGGSASTTGGPVATVTGTWNWVAVYDHDSNNLTATSPFGSEAVTVGPAQPSVRTPPTARGPMRASHLND